MSTRQERQSRHSLYGSGQVLLQLLHAILQIYDIHQQLLKRNEAGMRC